MRPTYHWSCLQSADLEMHSLCFPLSTSQKMRAPEVEIMCNFTHCFPYKGPEKCLIRTLYQCAILLAVPCHLSLKSYSSLRLHSSLISPSTSGKPTLQCVTTSIWCWHPCYSKCGPHCYDPRACQRSGPNKSESPCELDHKVFYIHIKVWEALV